MPEVMCSLCKKQGIKNLGNHLKWSHKLNTVQERLPYVQKIRKQLRDQKTPRVDKHLHLFCKQEKALSNDFKQLEKVFISLRLEQERQPYTKMLALKLQYEVREVLLPLYTTILAYLAENVHSAQSFNRKATHEAMQKKKRLLRRETVLENGLVQCNLCKFEWDGHAQHDCAYEDE